MAHLYEVNENINGAYSLVRDGNVCRCPKSSMLIPQVNGLSGQIVPCPTQMSCSTLCPFASFTDETREYLVSCEGKEKVFVIAKVNKPKEEKKLGIVAPIGLD
jgi:hypothetical protein